MQYYRCKCGNSEAWGSDAPPRCSRCSKCGSDLATPPDEHSEPLPHEFEASEKTEHYNACLQIALDVLVGAPDRSSAAITARKIADGIKVAAAKHERCRYCLRTRAQIEGVASQG